MFINTILVGCSQILGNLKRAGRSSTVHVACIPTCVPLGPHKPDASEDGPNSKTWWGDLTTYFQDEQIRDVLPPLKLYVKFFQYFNYLKVLQQFVGLKLMKVSLIKCNSGQRGKEFQIIILKFYFDFENSLN